MKKFAKIVAICLLAVMLTTMLASCSFIGDLFIGSIDLKEASDKLNDAGYEIYYIEDVSDTDNLDFEALGALYGAAYMLEALGIDEDPVSILIASDDNDEGFWAFDFKNESDAEDAFESFEDSWEAYSENSKSETTYAKNGTIIYFGTVQGVKDALGFPASLFISEK